MKLINERTEIANVAARWKEQYFRRGEWGTVLLGNAEVIHRNLLALPPDATAKDVHAIIGNTSWAGPQSCHECGREDVDAVVQVGQQPDYESSTADICLPCLRKAVALIESSDTTSGDA
jgi:hypothetical protein